MKYAISACSKSKLFPIAIRYVDVIWFVGFVCTQRLCINFSVLRVDFLTTLRSQLNVSCYFWSSLFNVDVNYSYILKCIEKDLVNYIYFDSC